MVTSNASAVDAPLTRSAQPDSLTGLSSRSCFAEALRSAVETTLSSEDVTAVFLINIDDFQAVNETLGISAGDKVLRQVASCLEIFAGETGTVGRLGGDEFAMLLPVVPRETSLGAIAAVIGSDLGETMDVAAGQVIRVCVGVASYPTLHDTGQPPPADASGEIMKQAGLALQAAKREGAGTCRLYVPAIDDRIMNRLRLRTALGGAIGSSQFKLYYQPMVALDTGLIVGAEAVVRWDHPELGILRPDLFIPLAEVSGLIVPLGRWIMTKAMRQGLVWKSAGLLTPPIAINISIAELEEFDFIDAVEQVLQETGADPQDYEIELKEALVVKASAKVVAIVAGLKSIGFNITLDDLGSDRADFNYMDNFPVDKIKIDQNFVRQLVVDSHDSVRVRAIIALAKRLGIKVVADGVKTTMQHSFFKNEGCDMGQGYLYSLPLTDEDFGWILRNQHTLPVPLAFSPHETSWH